MGDVDLLDGFIFGPSIPENEENVENKDYFLQHFWVSFIVISVSD